MSLNGNHYHKLLLLTLSRKWFLQPRWRKQHLWTTGHEHVTLTFMLQNKYCCSSLSGKQDPVSIRISFSMYDDFHYKDKTAVMPSYFYGWITFIGKTSSLYWASPQNAILIWKWYVLKFSLFLCLNFVDFTPEKNDTSLNIMGHEVDARQGIMQKLFGYPWSYNDAVDISINRLDAFSMTYTCKAYRIMGFP